MDPDKIKAALEAIKSGDAAAALELLEALLLASAGGGDLGEAVSDEAAPEALAEAPAEEPEEDALAALSLIRSVTGTKSNAAALSAVRKLAAVSRVLTQETAIRADEERADLVGELVKLGVEFPATAWADPDTRTPVKRLASEPLAELRDRVAAVRKLAKSAPELRPGTETITLSAADQARAAKMTPDQRARFEARVSRRGAN